jgi:glucosyl-3-phosphoglycerate synthase
MSSPSHPAGITTLHRLSPEAWPAMEAELSVLAGSCPVTLILPCHVRELGTTAFQGIVRELSGALWIKHIVVGLDGADAREADAARQVLTGLPQSVSLLWSDAPAVLALESTLRDAGQTTATAGKGRNVWLCAGLALASMPEQQPSVIAVHDCDIKNYSSELAGRLCHPLMTRQWGFRFNKGFYSRHSDRLHGRLQRLLVRPLLRAMELRAGPMGVLQFLTAFRYPLAGESAMDSALLKQLNFPSTWGLEIGLLEEVRRYLHPAAVCQTELCAAYDHKHQDLCPDDPAQGLHRMAREVSSTMLATVSGGTYPWREQILETWQAMAADALRHAKAESALNGLDHMPEQESLAVVTFGKALQAAIDEPAPPALLPSWEAAERAVPDILPRLLATRSSRGAADNGPE